VLVNLPTVDDLGWTEEMSRAVVDLQEAVEDVAQTTREAVGSRVMREPIDPLPAPSIEVER
jgi:hypothetical protein